MAKTKKSLTIEESLSRLEEISRELSNAEIDLDSSVALYKEAMDIIRSAEKKLEKTKLDIKLITESGEEDYEQ